MTTSEELPMQEPEPVTFHAVLFENGRPVVKVEMSDRQLRHFPITELGKVHDLFLEWIDASILAGSI